MNPAAIFAFALLPTFCMTWHSASAPSAAPPPLWGGLVSLTSHCADLEVAYVADRAMAYFHSDLCATSRLGNGEYGPGFLLGTNSVHERVAKGSAFLLKLVRTYLLVITVLNAAVSAKSVAGNAAPVRPSSSGGPSSWPMLPSSSTRGAGSTCSGRWSQRWWTASWSRHHWSCAAASGCWVYYLAPFVRSLLAALTHKYISEDRTYTQ